MSCGNGVLVARYVIAEWKYFYRKEDETGKSLSLLFKCWLLFWILLIRAMREIFFLLRDWRSYEMAIKEEEEGGGGRRDDDGKRKLMMMLTDVLRRGLPRIVPQ